MHRQCCMGAARNFRCNQHTSQLGTLYVSCASRRSGNRQAPMRIPYTAVCTRRRRLTTQSESQTSCTLPLVLHQPMHTVRQQPARKLQQLATDVHTVAGGSLHNIAPRRSDGSRTHSLPDRTTAVRTIRAYRRTSLCNSRAHSFAQLPQHLTRTSSSACTRTASSSLHTMHRNSAHQCHNDSVVL